MKLRYLSNLLIPLILGLAFAFKDEHDVIYVPIAFGICSMILFLNFPALVIMLHSRPIYYDDLIIKNYSDDEANRMYDDEFRRKYQRIFRLISTFTSSIMIAMAVALWFFRDRLFAHDADQRHDVFNNVAIVGIISGIFSIYYRATILIGTVIMFILKRLRSIEQERVRKYQENIVLNELSLQGIKLVSPPFDPPKDDEQPFMSDVLT